MNICLSLREPLMLLFLATILLLFVASCGDEPEPEEPPEAALVVLVSFDPDISNPLDPLPATIVWWSTRAGVTRFLADDGRELAMDRVAPSGGELVITPVEPRLLVPGLNDVEIYHVLQQQGGVVLRQTVTFFLDAECTLHDHCPVGACSNFYCQ